MYIHWRGLHVCACMFLCSVLRQAWLHVYSGQFHYCTPLHVWNHFLKLHNLFNMCLRFFDPPTQKLFVRCLQGLSLPGPHSEEKPQHSQAATEEKNNVNMGNMTLKTILTEQTLCVNVNMYVHVSVGKNICCNNKRIQRNFTLTTVRYHRHLVDLQYIAHI